MGLAFPSCAGLGLAVASSAASPIALHDARVLVGQPDAVAAGQRGELSLTLLELPFAGTPIELRLRATSGLALAENRVGWDNVVDPRANQPRIRVRFIAPVQPGSYEVLGHVTYITCGAKRCRPRRRHVRWTVEVTPPPSDAPLQTPTPPSSAG